MGHSSKAGFRGVRRNIVRRLAFHRKSSFGKCLISCRAKYEIKFAAELESSISAQSSGNSANQCRKPWKTRWFLRDRRAGISVGFFPCTSQFHEESVAHFIAAPQSRRRILNAKKCGDRSRLSIGSSYAYLLSKTCRVTEACQLGWEVLACDK